ncbi:unnamed protein product [Oikopleura dioica]|uniref:Uncharacterized protein n=1 Tax=Oikopleura dioica TaxID=34765 RepID=E4YUG0_OIKDI|nr:unnamed protein product [Oikopleura dioica]
MIGVIGHESLRPLGSEYEASLAADPHQFGYTLHKQIHLCSDSIHLLLLKPWDFICRLRVGPTFERQVMNLKCFQKIPYSTDSLLSRIIRCSNINFGAELVEFILYRPDQSYYEFGLGQTSECRCRGDTCLMIQNFDKAKAKKTLDQRRESYKIKPSEADARPRRVSAPNIKENPAQKVRRPSLISNRMAPLKQLLSVKNLPARCPTRADPNERDEFGVTPLMLLLYHRMVCTPIAKILLEAHADPNLYTKKGNTVLDALFRPRNFVSQSWDGVQTLKLLIRHGLSREILAKWKTKIKHVSYLSKQQIMIFEDIFSKSLL